MIRKTLFREILIFGLITFVVGIGIIPNIAKDVSDNDEMDLIASWHFDEGNGSTVYDDSGNNNKGILYGATWIAGISGFALEFDGINDYISVTDSNGLDINGNITIEVWIYPYSMPWVAPLVFKGTNSSNYGYYLAFGQYYSNGCASFKLHSNDTKILWLDSISPLATGQWHYLSAVRAGDNASIYIDGIINNADSYFTSPIQTNNLPLKLGTYNDHSEFFHGILDEVSIYNYALTPSEIHSHYREILNKSKWDEGDAPEPLSKDTPGFEIIIVFISIAIVAAFRWKNKKY
jgi:hypothetical protein